MNKFSKHRFFNACGGSRPLKLLLENRETGFNTLYTFEQPNLLIGQHPLADIRLRHPDIGERHLYLQMLEGRMYGVAFPGEKPTYWDDDAKTGGWIDEAHTLHFAPFTLRIVEGTRPLEDPAELGNPMASAFNGTPPLLLEQHSTSRQRAFRGMVNRSLTLVGNAELCKFRISNDRISSIHCSLVRAKDGFWAIDLSGTGRVAVNASAISFAMLEEGDVLHLGNIPFQIHYDSQPSPTATVRRPLASPTNEPLALAQLPLESPVVIGSGQLDRASFENLIGPVLDRFTAFQNQTFQQFQDLLGNVMQMFGSMFQQQNELVREEMQRYEQLTEELRSVRKALLEGTSAAALPMMAELIDSNPLPPQPVDSRTVSPDRMDSRPASPEPSRDAAAMDPALHVWLQSRIAQLDTQRENLWSRLFGVFRGQEQPYFERPTRE